MVPYDPKIGHVWQKKKVPEEEIRTELDKYFRKAFY